MARTAREPLWLEELIDLAPHWHEPMLAARGAVYNVLRHAFGESDLIAASYSLHQPRATRPGAPLNSRQITAFFEGGPAAVAAA